jgi:3-oxoacyl-[acyl-carrier protein] reductase
VVRGRRCQRQDRRPRQLRGRLARLGNRASRSLARRLGRQPLTELQAPADLCRSAIVHFRDCGGGVIINVASRSSHRGDDADHLAYGAAKGGLLSLTKGIARGYARDNILAYAVAPEWVATEIAVQAQEASSAAAQLPLGEITPPQDVAEVIAFLASGRSRHATGATIDITGADYVR